MLVSTACPKLGMGKAYNEVVAPVATNLLSFCSTDEWHDSHEKAGWLNQWKQNLRNETVHKKQRRQSLLETISWRSVHQHCLDCLSTYEPMQGDHCTDMYNPALKRANFFLELPSFHCLQLMHLPAWQFIESLISAMSFQFCTAKKYVPSATASTMCVSELGGKQVPNQLATFPPFSPPLKIVFFSFCKSLWLVCRMMWLRNCRRNKLSTAQKVKKHNGKV